MCKIVMGFMWVKLEVWEGSQRGGGLTTLVCTLWCVRKMMVGKGVLDYK